MRYFQIKFHLEGEDITPEKRATAFDLTAALSASAGLEIFDEDGGDLTGYVQEDLFDKSVLESVLADFPMEGITVNVDISKADYEDWNAPWEEAGFEPIVIDQRCVIHDMKHTPPSIDGALDIVIDARMAFGTGTHETTQMMVGELLRHDLEGKRVLDCGCGTGILSIVASKSGASDIVAYDIDEWSVENTEHNARLNGIDNIEVLTGDVNVLSHVSGLFDYVLANINLNILLADMASIREVMASGGHLLVSGFYTSDVEALKAEAQRLGLTCQSSISSGSWAMLSFSA
ncbi:MAG: 50S ribosomal protein L11 methyltransferase [Lentisphaeria bacterium]|nr:50S ribosomal protein L11 methyltransferase [Lentisphaeria bacterium]